MSSSSSSSSFLSLLFGSEMDIATTMTLIFLSLLVVLFGLVLLQTPKNNNNNKIKQSSSSSTNNNNNNNNYNILQSIQQSMIAIEPSKRSYELFVAYYTPFWIGCFTIIIIFQLYENFTATTYNVVCFGLALPLLLQPIVYPTGPDQYRPLIQRYSFKANIWLAIYSIIGNYWYTHYFYSVLKASYSMPAIRWNNVPIAMFGATHFYFTTYHWFSNCLLRAITTLYEPNIVRSILFISTIVVFAYFTAFMETLTISSYPYYTFDDRYMAYTVGSAFYGIYFIVSYPAFFYFDNNIDNVTTTTTSTISSNDKTQQQQQYNVVVVTVWDTIVSSCGYGMIILFLLDFVRLYLDIPLVVGTSNLQCTNIQQ